MFWRHFLFFATIHAYNVGFYQFRWVVLTIKQLIKTIKLRFYWKLVFWVLRVSSGGGVFRIIWGNRFIRGSRDLGSKNVKLIVWTWNFQKSCVLTYLKCPRKLKILWPTILATEAGINPNFHQILGSWKKVVKFRLVVTCTCKTVSGRIWSFGRHLR